MKCPKCGKRMKRVQRSSYKCFNCGDPIPRTYRAKYFEIIMLKETGEVNILKNWNMGEKYLRVCMESQRRREQKGGKQQ